MRAASLRTAMTAAWRASLVHTLQSHAEQAHVPTPTPPADWAAPALDFGAYFDLCLASLDTQSSRAKAVGEVACHWLQRRFSGKKTTPVQHSELQVSRQQPLVLNPIDMRFDSPLCDEASAMDNVFHAAFVSAREVWALRRAVAHTGRLAGNEVDPQRTGFQERLRMSEYAFWACDKQIANGAELSPLGATVLRESRNHVLSLAAGDRSFAAFDQHPTELLAC